MMPAISRSLPKVTRAIPADIPAIVAAWGAAFFPYEPQPSIYGAVHNDDVLRYRAKAWSEQAFEPGNALTKVERDGTIVGFAWWAERSPPEREPDPVGAGEPAYAAEWDGGASLVGTEYWPVENEFPPGTRIELIAGFRQDIKKVKKVITEPYYEREWRTFARSEGLFRQL